jgi:hypothetical protein
MGERRTSLVKENRILARGPRQNCGWRVQGEFQIGRDWFFHRQIRQNTHKLLAKPCAKYIDYRIASDVEGRMIAQFLQLAIIA